MIAKCFISLGIKKGDHIALLSCNSPEWLIVYLAGLKIGAVLVCLDYTSTEKELEFTLKHSDSSILIVSDKDMIEKVDVDKFKFLKTTIKMKTLFNLGFIISEIKKVSDQELLEASNKVQPDDFASIIYTSGSTGKPKGVVHTQSAILNGALSHINNFQYSNKDKILVSVPLHHILGGYYTAILGLLAGSTLVLMKKFKTSTALKIIEKEKCTGFHGVPTMYQYFIENHHEYDIYSLRVGMIAGAFCSESLLKNIFEQLNITQLNHTYGQTECLGVTQTPIYSPDNEHLLSVGKAVDYVQIKIIDIYNGNEMPPNTSGELCVKSPYIMSEYYKDLDKTNSTLVDGWIHTGDIAQIDESGYLSIKGRLKDIIIRGGENISPLEIEECLNNSPKIDSSIALGVPDNIMGEEIFLFVKAKKNYNISKNDITDFILKNLSKYKCPKYIEFLEDFPLTSNGKIHKNILKELALSKIK